MVSIRNHRENYSSRKADNVTEISFFFIFRERNGKSVHDQPDLKGRFVIKEDNFIISVTDADDHGNYTCSIPELQLSAEIRVVCKLRMDYNETRSDKDSPFFNFAKFDLLLLLLANAYLKKMHESLNVVEGDQLKIHCIAFGTDPEITWTVGKFDLY